ncbi:MAG: hypothetical protein ACFFCX_16960, partial [Candidatus Sifarchaeia archaeon]
ADDRIGKIIVALHDETSMQIAHVEVGDPWTAISYAFSNCLYQWSNGTDIFTTLSHPETTSPEPHFGNVTLLQNSTGMFSQIPNGNNERLIDSLDIESDRVVKYISVYIARHNSYSVTETLRLHEIELNWTPISWHDDCSDISVFNGYGDDSWGHNSDVSVTFGSVSSSGTFFYSTDVGIGSGHHGPLLYHTLENGFTLAQFRELQVEFEMDALGADRRGWIRVGLHAPDNSSILTLQLADPWIGVAATYVNAIYRFSNATTTETPQTTPNPEPFHDSLLLFSNSSGLYTSFPGIASSQLLESGQIEESRVIKHVSIQFNGYDTGALCETMRIHDINLRFGGSYFEIPSPLPPSLTPITWFDDCSNINNFPGFGDNSWPRDPSLEVSFGFLASIGGYIYATDYGSGSSYHGPLRYHTLAVPFKVSDIESFEATFEIDASSASQTCLASVYLHDDTNKSIVGLHVSDAWTGSNQVKAKATWIFSNSTWTNTPEDSPYLDSEPYYETLRVTQNSTGIFAEIPRIGNFKVVDAKDIDPDRIVRYVSIHLQVHSTLQVYDVVRVHNITLNWYDSVSPTIDHPVDLWYPEAQSGNVLTWNPSDNYPDSYEIYRDGLLFKSGEWNSSDEAITISIDGLSLGSYNYNCIVKDVHGNSVSDEVQVTVFDGTNPSIDHPEDFQYNEFTTGNVVSWSPSDLHPISYAVYLGSSPVRTGSWNSSLESIVVSVDGHGIGIYNYTCVVTDVGGNTAVDTVFVTVADATAPTIDSPANINYPEYDTGHAISWNPNDANPKNYTIYGNDTPIKTGLWNSSLESISISVDGHGLGLFNYTIIAFDADGNSVTDTVMVTVYDGTFPIVDSPSNVFFDEGDTGHQISWTPTDAHPASYEIFRDAVSVKSGVWNSSSEIISISLDGLSIGIYNYVIVVTDVGDNTAMDTVTVTVVDATSPTINSPSDVDYPEFDVDNSISWNPNDANPKNYTVLLDGVPARSGSWNSSSESVSISVDGHGLGLFNYTIIVFDVEDNYAFDTVMVTVHDGTSPVVDSPFDVFFDEGDTGHQISWTPTDAHPASYEIFRDAVSVKSGFWNTTSETVSISLDGLPYGAYTFVIIITDIGNNTDSDTVLVQVSDGASPVIDTPDDIEYDEGNNNVTITWTPSDLNPTTYEIMRDGVPLRVGLWNSSSETISIQAGNLIIGMYNFTIVVYDIEGNSASDQVMVTVVDGTLPIIDSPSDVEYVEGSLGDVINWTPSDLHPDRYEIYRNGTLVDSGTWDGSPIEINVGGLATGVHEYMLIVWDIGNNNATDVVFVTVIEEITPTTTPTTGGGLPPDIFTLIIAVGSGATIIIVIVIIVYLPKYGRRGG